MKISNTIRKTFAPLIVTRHFEVLGSALTQVYKAVELAYEPNRTITPTVILPLVSVTDPDGVYPNGPANLSLGGIKWYVGGVDITTTQDYINGLYAIDYSDTSARGSLTIYKNVSSEAPVLLSFRATLPDTRRGINLSIAIEGIMLSTQAVASDKYTLELNQPVEYIHNPITAATNEVTFIAVAFRGADIIANNTSGITFSLLKNVAGSFVAATSDNCHELISSALGAFVFDVRMIQKNDYMIKLLKASVEVAAVQFSVVRQYPVFTLDLMSYGDVQSKQAVIPAKAVIHTRGTVVSNPALYFSIVWHTVTTTKGDVTHNMGETAEIPAQKTGIDTSACEIYCEVNEKPAMQLSSNSGGVAYMNFSGIPYINN